ncbi:MAG: O-antigen ligase family protein [Eubacteriales bacterium]|nr:O-antigen ligase family protein [Eubacteriales bacterium]
MIADQKYKFNRINIIILSAMLYAFLSQYRVFSFRYSALAYLFLIALVPFVSLMSGRHVINKYSLILLISIAVLFFGIFISGNIADSANVWLGKTFLIIIYAFMLRYTDWYNVYQKTASFFCAAILISIYLQYILPDIIITISRLIMTESHYAAYMKLVDMGYKIGISLQASYAAYNVAILAVFCFAFLLLKPGRRLLNILTLIASVGAIMLSGKRAEFAAILIAMLITAALLIFNKKLSARRRATYLLLIVASIIIILLVLLNSALGTLLFSKGMELSYDATRTFLTEEGIRLWKNHIWFGNGTNYFSQNYEFSVHNTYLQLLCENGIIGMAVYSLFFISNLIITMKTFSAFAHGDYRTPYVIASFAFQVFFLVSAYFESMFANNVMFINYLFMTAMPLSMYFQSKNRKITL